MFPMEQPGCSVSILSGNIGVSHSFPACALMQESSWAPVCLVFVQLGAIDVTQHDRCAWIPEDPAFVVLVQVPVRASTCQLLSLIPIAKRRIISSATVAARCAIFAEQQQSCTVSDWSVRRRPRSSHARG
jgi:hypothetical protein